MTPQRRYEIYCTIAGLFMELAEEIREQIAPAPNPAPPPAPVPPPGGWQEPGR